MKRIVKSLVFASFLFFGTIGMSYGNIVFSENFNAVVETGSLLSGDILQSEKWNPTNYYIGTPTLSGWTFSTSGAYVATNAETVPDKAILLNESPSHGTMSTTISELIASTDYWLTFDHWGDNRPDDPGYTLIVQVDGGSETISREYNFSGLGMTEYIRFTAPSSGDITLTFSDNTTTGQASAIIDNISISTVPIPGAVWLLGSGLIGIVGIRRKLKN